MKNQVSTTYATQVLQKTQEELQKETKSLPSSQPFSQIGQLQPTIARLASAIAHNDQTSARRSLQQIAAQQQSLQSQPGAGGQ